MVRSCWMDCTDSEQYRRLGEGVFGRIDRSAGNSHLGVSQRGGSWCATERREMSQAGGRDSKQQSWLVMGVQQYPATAVAVVIWGLVVGGVLDWIGLWRRSKVVTDWCGSTFGLGRRREDRR
jgi:hypothetical protein